jgi:hypothetical protein
MGGYISQDPLRLRGGTRLHSYVNDPITWIDPFGLEQYFRGSRDKDFSFTPKPNEYKIDPKTNLVQTSHGVSVFNNPQSILGKGIPNVAEVELSSVPDSLKIIQRGKDLNHFEIVPKVPMPLEDYKGALSKIQTCGN